MSRKARVMEKNRPHHILSRSIPELDLFRRDEDREVYLSLMKTSSQVHQVTIVAYCLMDNHVHLLIHPNGGNISKFMKNINNPYAKYYNRIYNRRGHLYSDRFKNIIIKDEAHLIRTSTYIHNNAKDLLWKGYKSIEDYPYSSIMDFIDPARGRRLAKPTLVFDYMSGSGKDVRNHYKVLLEIQSQGHESFEKEIEDTFRSCTSEKLITGAVRQVDPEKVIDTLSEILAVRKRPLELLKYKRDPGGYKAIIAVSLRVFSGMTLRELTKVFCGYTESGVGRLSKVGCHLLIEGDLYQKISSELR